MSYAPIALFVYNRPSHTIQTVEALQRNKLAAESDLFIFSDAPKTPEAIDSVVEVREFVHGIAGFRTVTVVERERNFGLAASIIDGVTNLCDKCGQVIVLEDDLVVSPVFLDYMNAALDKYRDESKVMQISGNMFPVAHPEILPKTFFCRATTSWGWATWQRAWSKFEPSAHKLVTEIISQKLRKEFDLGGDYLQMLVMQASGKVDSWAIRWYASVFLADGLCLHPSMSLVANIGHDGSGVHCGSNNKYDIYLSSVMPNPFPLVIEESPLGRQALEKFHRSTQLSLIRRIWRRLNSIFRRVVSLS